ncbi:MAG: sigma-54-dependent Fis family transcriptional regulator [Myxococcota bacterium]
MLEVEDGALVLGSGSGSDTVARAWQRARDLGVDPSGRGHAESIERAASLAARRRSLRTLLTAGDEVLDDLARQLARSDFALLLADHEGVVVRRLGGGQFEAVADEVRLIEGAHWCESIRGTNAIGTALVEKAPVTVVGDAHFARPNQGLVCYASPVRDPSGDVVAVLDATGVVERADDFVGVAVRSAATALEDRLRLQRWPTRGPASLRVLQQMLARCAVPAFVVERPGTVRAANGAATALLDGPSACLGSTLGLRWTDLERLVSDGALPTSIAHRLARTFPHQQLHVEPVLGAGDDLWAAVVFLEPRTAGRGTASRRTDTLPAAFSRLEGNDGALRSVLVHASRIAETTLPVLINSETGTGKELLARAIHDASDRRNAPMVTLNCGAVSPELMASELFGYAPGAFTGADPKGRDGKVAAAAGGTLFLDELAEMPRALQVLLLRFLESGSYHRVGESKLRHVNVRLLCATCRDLDALVEQGEFRRDLFYRINGAVLSLPPLRLRRDLDVLANVLLGQLAEAESVEPRPRLTSRAHARLRRHDWPGNVRELKMVLHHALVLSRGHACIDAEDLVLPDGRRDVMIEPEPSGTMRSRQREALAEALSAAGGNVSAAARALGVARSTVYRQLKRYGLLDC